MVAFGFFMLAFLFSPTQGILTHPYPKSGNQPQLDKSPIPLSPMLPDRFQEHSIVSSPFCQLKINH